MIFSRLKIISSSNDHFSPTVPLSEVRRSKRQRAKGLTFSEAKIPRYEEASQSESDQAIKHVLPNLTTVKTNILLLSDTHGKVKLPQKLSFDKNGHLLGKSFQNQKIHVLIHTGDLSDSGSLSDYQATLDLISSIPAELKLVIPGNHDLTLDKEFWNSHATILGQGLSDEAEKLFESRSKLAGEENQGQSEEKREGGGITFLRNGLYKFKLGNGGALRIYAGSKTPYPDGDGAGLKWAFGYPSNTDIYNPLGQGISYAKPILTPETLIPNDSNLDIIMTHGPPKYRLDQKCSGTNNTQTVALGCPHLFRAVRRAKPKLHVFGHIHEGYGAELIQWTGKPKSDVLPDDDDIDDGISEKRRLFGNETGGGVRFLNAQESGGIRGAGSKEINGEEQRGNITLFVNAALMGSEENGELENFPWVIELELQTSDLKITNTT